jgi:SAM-dependent methyltransferase
LFPWKEAASSRDWLAPVRALDENVLFPYRYAQLTRRLSPHLQDVANVLDVGASCGRLARRLMDVTRCDMIGIDIHLQPNSSIEVRRYDGRTFPFADGAFDCVLMVDMLHHSADIEQMLKEARRVSRRYILLKDHYWENSIDHILLCAADYLGNAPYGVSLPYHYLRQEEWAGLFDRHRLKTVSLERFRYNPFDPCRHLVAKLQVDES